jgi:uncharacterized lipoprotein YmbA
MLSGVLVQDLTQRLPQSTVFSEAGAISAAPDATVSVNVQRFDADRSGAVVLDADVAVRRGDRTVTRHAHLMAPVAGPGAPDLVAGMSAAVGQLADLLAGMLVAPAPRG